MANPSKQLFAAIYLAIIISPLILVGGCSPEGGLNSAGLAPSSENVSQQGFADRPASVADIIAQLEAERPDPTQAARQRRLADTAELPAMMPSELVRFLIQRSDAKAYLGRASEEIADAQRAVDIVRSMPNADDLLKIEALDRLAQAETIGGSMRAGLSAASQGVAIVISSRTAIPRITSLRVARRAVQAASHLRQRDIATDMLSKLENFYRRGDDGTQHQQIILRLQVQMARAQFEDAFGPPASAESAWRQALRTYDELLALPNPSPMTYTWGIGSRLAVNLLQQGRFSEAEVEVRRDLLLRLKAGGRYSTWGALAISTLAQTLVPQGRVAEAERLLLIAIETYQQMGYNLSQISILRARAALADAYAAQERWREAIAQYRQIETALTSQREQFNSNFARRPTYVAAQLATGNATGAAASAQAALARHAGTETPEIIELRALLGAALFARGDSQGARQEFAAAVPKLIESESTLSSLDGGENVAARRIRLALESYLDLLLQAHSRGDATAAEEAFQVADAARSGQVRRALAAVAARAAAGGSGGAELAALARREQDATEQAARLEALASAELAEPSATRNNSRIASLRAEAAGLRQTRVQIVADITRRFPSYAEMAEPRPATVAQARARLRPGEAMAAYYVGQKRTYLFGVSHGSTRVSFAAAGLGDAQISAAVSRLRAPLEAEVATANELPAFDVAAAHRLYRELLLPLGPEVLAANELVTVPHRALGMLPFHLLVTEPPPAMGAEQGSRFSNYRRVAWLARRTAVSQVPSVSALTLLRSIPAGRADRLPFIGFGDPWFNDRQARLAMAEGGEIATAWRRAAPTGGRSSGRRSATGPVLGDLERLPDTAQELRDVAASIGADPGRDVRLGRQATEGAVRGADLRNRRVVMFATHGLVPGDLEGLAQPALALTPPSVAGSGAGDGLLTADEILSLRLDADWVVLSACNTAAADADAAEAVSGLGRAFLYAGARSLLVTNWAVDSEAARLLTSELFRSQAQDRTLSRAEALRRAMMTLINSDAGAGGSNRAGFTYAHPLFWAPFSLIGDGGG